jgi:uncharacterized membrane protein YfcA
MNVLAFSLIVCVASVLAGFLGALTGLGGGVVIVQFFACFLKSTCTTQLGRLLFP